MKSFLHCKIKVHGTLLVLDNHINKFLQQKLANSDVHKIIKKRNYENAMNNFPMNYTYNFDDDNQIKTFGRIVEPAKYVSIIALTLSKFT